MLISEKNENNKVLVISYRQGDAIQLAPRKDITDKNVK
jgi:hypothetical protein